MKLRVIGTEAECLWLSGLIRPYISTVKKPNFNSQTGRYSVYYTLKMPNSKEQKPSNINDFS